ncbi:MAG TPA: ThiF family adenylyltransferase [Pseudogracilibacillus sp.]|nr:ThiF family adenylyltransferase [Pseudogracilibacillus sp.]
MNRYSRQLLFEPIGEAGQEKLLNSHVLIVGLGALGAVSAEMFARSGIGTMTILDRDYVEMSNLQRQPLYDTNDANEQLPKAIAAKKRLMEINPTIKVNAIVEDVTADILKEHLDGVQMMIDGTDNFDIRMIMNDLSQKYNLPWIYGSCVGSYGLSYLIKPNETPCLHCVIEHIPLAAATCDTVGIIQPAATQVALYQVTEAMKCLVGDHQHIQTKLRTFDLWKNEQSTVDIKKLKRKHCPSCGPEATYPFLQSQKQTDLAVLCGRDTVQIRKKYDQELDLMTLSEKFKENFFQVKVNEYLLSLQVDPYRIVLFRDGRALVHGTKDKMKAHTIYDRYFS